ncbi:MAG: hypothetical protein JF616_01595 [Fibrobacteres bacterium]|nr:hypothetical protein [Fibrobacterota bacterium]
MRRHGILGPAALLLAAVFFVAQVFACCQANARLGRSLLSMFARTSQPAHACCARAAAREPLAPPAHSGCAAGQCCLHQAAQNAPQLASAPSEAPVFSVSLVLLPAFIEPPVALGEWPPTVIDSGPPIYLRTLRLLV